MKLDAASSVWEDTGTRKFFTVCGFLVFIFLSNGFTGTADFTFGYGPTGAVGLAGDWDGQQGATTDNGPDWSNQQKSASVSFWVTGAYIFVAVLASCWLLEVCRNRRAISLPIPLRRGVWKLLVAIPVVSA